jgi:hypothetical protein
MYSEIQIRPCQVKPGMLMEAYGQIRTVQFTYYRTYEGRRTWYIVFDYAYHLAADASIVPGWPNYVDILLPI